MHRSLRTALPIALAVALAAPVTASYADEPASPRAAVRTSASEPLLRHAAGGHEAIRQLGNDLDEAARRSRMSTVELREVLSTDSTAKVFPNGRLAYVDSFEEHAFAPSAAAALADVDPAETFTLDSRPGSKHTIYLDFTGETVSGTAWNVSADNPDGIPDQFYRRFSLDADYTSTYSQAEHNYIQEVWRLVAETYAAFDVNVTTKAPPASAYNRDGAGDFTYGDHVLFTDDPASDPICDPNDGCGGVAWVSTFDDPYDGDGFFEPAWVRPLDTPFAAAMAASHEIGHTLGLSHDGRTSPAEAYYAGHGAWTPIMGSGINAIHQFSQGEYANANNKQDDFAAMQASGLPLLPDDAGDSTAKALTWGARNDTFSGVIGSRTDADYFKIGPCTTAPTASAVGSGSGSALDLKLTAYTTGGGVASENNPVSGQVLGTPRVATGMDAQVALPAGTYFLKVDGVGAKSPLTDGYSDYGSIGTYSLTVSSCVASNGAAPNAPTGLTLGVSGKGSATVSWGEPVGGPAPTGYRISGLTGGPIEVPTGTTSRTVTVNGGTDYDVEVVALNGNGAGPAAKQSVHANSFAPTAAPTVSVTTNVLTARLRWSPAANPGRAGLVHWRIEMLGKAWLVHPSDRETQFHFSTYGTVNAKLIPVYDAEDGSVGPSRSFQIVIAVKPSAPKIGTASSGRKGRPVTATARWTPRYNGGAAITSYKVVAYRLNTRGRIIGSKVSRALPGSARAYAFPLAKGKYKFRVVAYNVKGGSVASSYSRAVTAK